MNDNDRRPEIQESAQDMSEVLRIRREKLNTLMLEGKNPYLQTHYKTDISHKEIRDAFETLEGKKVSVAGRMMSRRIMGKASFMDLRMPLTGCRSMSNAMILEKRPMQIFKKGI